MKNNNPYSKLINELVVKLAPSVHNQIIEKVKSDPNLNPTDNDFRQWVAKETLNQAIAISDELNKNVNL